MKKAVFICSGNHFPKGVFEFARQQQCLEPLLLTGAFFYNMSYRQMLSESLRQNPWLVLKHTQEDEKAVNACIERFEQLCMDNSIEYSIHKESPLWNINDVVVESRFADLLLLSEESFYNVVHTKPSNHFLYHLLRYSECPIILIPEDYKSIKGLSIVYDGKRESMFALKQFCYLFPQLAEIETEIFFARNGDSHFIPYSHYLKEYASRYFKNLTLKKIQMSLKDYTEFRIAEQKDVLIVSGAFSRSLLSANLERSFFKKILKEHRSLVFIAPSS